ncbi:MAG TPA: 4Fe-4S dicluster domain-containing protein [Bryobacterales bacterium]|nr:4Fe-4S dicluster domain-containing protein [Bryobacterales bacterium]
MGSDAERDDVTSVLIVGVGGQGVIMVSKVLATLCQEHGLEVKQSEVHGMAKRGGAVFSHVRFGRHVHSPVIPTGEADVLLALEWAEGLRWLHFLDPEKGTFISDVRKIVPPFACRDRGRGVAPQYAKTTPRDVLEKVSVGYALDATGIAAKLGNERAANTVLLGILSTALKFSEREWLEVIERLVPPKTREINRAAFLAGREWVNEATVPEGEVLPVPEVDPVLKNVVNRLEITEAWCKGCDICVKFCPERCLALNESGKVVVKDADACTGCRLCEMLCPDFAIRLHKELPAEVAR